MNKSQPTMYRIFNKITCVPVIVLCLLTLFPTAPESSFFMDPFQSRQCYGQTTQTDQDTKQYVNMQIEANNALNHSKHGFNIHGNWVETSVKVDHTKIIDRTQNVSINTEGTVSLCSPEPKDVKLHASLCSDKSEPQYNSEPFTTPLKQYSICPTTKKFWNSNQYVSTGAYIYAGEIFTIEPKNRTINFGSCASPNKHIAVSQHYTDKDGTQIPFNDFCTGNKPIAIPGSKENAPNTVLANQNLMSMFVNNHTGPEGNKVGVNRLITEREIPLSSTGSSATNTLTHRKKFFNVPNLDEAYLFGRWRIPHTMFSNRNISRVYYAHRELRRLISYKLNSADKSDHANLLHIPYHEESQSSSEISQTLRGFLGSSPGASLLHAMAYRIKPELAPLNPKPHHLYVRGYPHEGANFTLANTAIVEETMGDAGVFYNIAAALMADALHGGWFSNTGVREINKTKLERIQTKFVEAYISEEDPEYEELLNYMLAADPKNPRKPKPIRGGKSYMYDTPKEQALYYNTLSKAVPESVTDKEVAYHYILPYTEELGLWYVDHYTNIANSASPADKRMLFHTILSWPELLYLEASTDLKNKGLPTTKPIIFTFPPGLTSVTNLSSKTKSFNDQPFDDDMKNYIKTLRNAFPTPHSKEYFAKLLAMYNMQDWKNFKEIQDQLNLIKNRSSGRPTFPYQEILPYLSDSKLAAKEAALNANKYRRMDVFIQISHALAPMLYRAYTPAFEKEQSTSFFQFLKPGSDLDMRSYAPDLSRYDCGDMTKGDNRYYQGTDLYQINKHCKKFCRDGGGDRYKTDKEFECLWSINLDPIMNIKSSADFQNAVVPNMGITAEQVVAKIGGGNNYGDKGYCLNNNQTNFACADLARSSNIAEQSIPLFKPIQAPESGELKMMVLAEDGKYDKIYGGYNLQIKQLCTNHNGQKLYGYITNNPAELTSIQPGDVGTFEIGDGMEINRLQNSVLRDGMLYLGYKIESGRPISEAHGYYEVKITITSHTRTLFSKLADGIVNIIYSKLHGDVDPVTGMRQGGYAKTMYNSLVKQITSLVQSVLLLYITFSGIGYFTGTTPASKDHIAKSVIRIGVIMQLISPTSWDFFNLYLFSALRMIMVQVINILGNPRLSSITQVHGTEDSFNFFDGILGIFVSDIFWMRLVAIYASGILGFVVGVLLTITMFKVLKACLYGLLLYVQALLGLALMFAMAPLFLITILFATTRNIFEAWLKQMISYIAQPLFYFATLAIMIEIITQIMNNNIAYMICTRCVAMFWVFAFYPVCIMKFVFPAEYIHYMESYARDQIATVAKVADFLSLDLSKISNVFDPPLVMPEKAFLKQTGDLADDMWFRIPFEFTTIILLLIMGRMMKNFASIAQTIASSLVGFSPAIQNLHAPAKGASQSLASLVGMDKESKARRGESKSLHKRFTDRLNKRKSGSSANESGKSGKTENTTKRQNITKNKSSISLDPESKRKSLEDKQPRGSSTSSGLELDKNSDRDDSDRGGSGKDNSDQDNKQRKKWTDMASEIKGSGSSAGSGAGSGAGSSAGSDSEENSQRKKWTDMASEISGKGHDDDDGDDGDIPTPDSSAGSTGGDADDQ